MLQQKRVIEEAVWSNPQIDQFIAEDDNPGLSVTLFDLVKTLQTVLERAKTRPVYEVSKEDVSVPAMIAYLRELMTLRPTQTLRAIELFESQHSRRAMICLFLAILELVRRQALVLEQGDAFGDIQIARHENFDSVFASGEAIEAVEKEYS